ncbi:hypothetical protein [Marinobacterium arenosum]|uniref:hypothetical protein n=1 Tax=Marinobacterium arenosum TaxID=2862496 RepID=UPI001C96105F|nr:hypothetical protein [Marinobacterium arenosum]MBY4677042.1 hypothetical protein [Marinobacterium arenosum]
MNWLFPEHKRELPASRAISVGLRSLHLVGISGLAGGYLYQLPLAQWWPFLWLALASGLLMLLKELYQDGIWLLQLRGQAVLLKVALLALSGSWYGGTERWVYILVILLSGVIAHAPGKVRYYSCWHRCVLTREVWQSKRGR